MKYVDLIAKSFGVSKKKIKENLLVSDFNWDSLTKINIISNVNNKYKKTLDFRKFEKIKTFNDLNKLITSSLK